MASNVNPTPWDARPAEIRDMIMSELLLTQARDETIGSEHVFKATVQALVATGKTFVINDATRALRAAHDMCYVRYLMLVARRELMRKGGRYCNAMPVPGYRGQFVFHLYPDDPVYDAYAEDLGHIDAMVDADKVKYLAIRNAVRLLMLDHLLEPEDRIAPGSDPEKYREFFMSRQKNNDTRKVIMESGDARNYFELVSSSRRNKGDARKVILERRWKAVFR